MKTISIVADSEEKRFRAISGNRQSVGKTMGEALDALAAQLSDSEAGTLVFIQKRIPDHFFTAAQHDRMEELRQRRRTLTQDELRELEDLVNAEIDATVSRTDALIRHISA